MPETSFDHDRPVSSPALPAHRRLTIEAIEVTGIRVPLDRIFAGSRYQMTHRSTVITRVHTAEGIVGEAYAGDEDHALTAIARIIKNEIEPQLLGQDAFSIERCWELARPATFNILRDRRWALVASAGVDAAVWDAIGKALGQPLWRLWGGYTDRLPLISIGGYYFDDADVRSEVAELRERDLAGMKLKVGGLTPEEDAARFKAARDVAGPGFVLVADANQAWTPQQAIRFVRLVEDYDLYWFEEPCRWHNDKRAMRDVRQNTGARICAGQSELSAGGCRDLMAEGAIDVCNFDSSWSGGPTEWRRVAAIASSFDVAMGHHEEPQIAAHLLASIPHSTFLECFDPARDPIWWNLVANRPAISDGAVQLSHAPGLGWELDNEYIARYRVDLGLDGKALDAMSG